MLRYSWPECWEVCREVFFEVNGVPRVVEVVDKQAGSTGRIAREQADKTSLGSVGAPMSGEVVEVSVKPGALPAPSLHPPMHLPHPHRGADARYAVNVLFARTYTHSPNASPSVASLTLTTVCLDVHQTK